MSLFYDVIIVGAGPAGIFTALELTRSGQNSLKILIIEKGKDIQERECRLTGWGGAGAYSDGKLTLSTEVGGTLFKDFSASYAENLLQLVDKIYVDFGAPKDLYGVDEIKFEGLKRKATMANLKLITMKIRHLGTERCFSILKDMRNFLQNKIDVLTDTEVKQIITEKNFVKGVITKEGKEYSGRYVVVAPGRVGANWLAQEAQRLGLKQQVNPVDVGVRVEVPAVVAEPLTESIYEAKLLFTSRRFDDKVRTFCMCPYGEVVIENYEGVITVNGHSYGNKKTNNTNFAILVSKNFTEPFKEPISYGKYIAQLANLLGEGVIIQRLGDLLLGRRSTESRIKKSIVTPTLTTATPGDLSLVFPYRHLTSIIEMLEALDKVAPGIYSPHTLLYGVEVKFYSSKLTHTKYLETEINNLFIAGDGAGITRGLIQASASGILVAKEILRREKKE